jgi:hypothetical protein
MTRIPIWGCLLLCVAGVFFPAARAHAASDEVTFEAQLVWGTNDEKPDSKLKPIGPILSGKLKNSPFRWAHYFEVHRETFKCKVNEQKTVMMSKNCMIKVTNLGDGQVEFQLWGKGQLVNTVRQKLPKTDLLITGGDAENSTAWFVVLRQVE